MVKKLDESMAALSKVRLERVEARARELAGQAIVDLASMNNGIGGGGAANIRPAATRSVEDVMPIRSEAEYMQVLETIRTLAANVTDEARDGHLLALQQRAQVYEQRQRVDPQRLQALDELVAQAQELKMGYD